MSVPSSYYEKYGDKYAQAVYLLLNVFNDANNPTAKAYGVGAYTSWGDADIQKLLNPSDPRLPSAYGMINSIKEASQAARREFPVDKQARAAMRDLFGNEFASVGWEVASIETDSPVRVASADASASTPPTEPVSASAAATAGAAKQEGWPCRPEGAQEGVDLSKVGVQLADMADGVVTPLVEKAVAAVSGFRRAA